MFLLLLFEAHLFYTLPDDDKHRTAKKRRYGSFLADLRGHRESLTTAVSGFGAFDSTGSSAGRFESSGVPTSASVNR
jgi:hypothetical protein